MIYIIDLHECSEPCNPDTLSYFGSTIIETSLSLNVLEQILVYDGDVITQAVAWDITELQNIVIITVHDFGTRAKLILQSIKNNDQITFIDPNSVKLDMSTYINYESEIFILENMGENNEEEEALKSKSLAYYSLQSNYNWGASHFVTKVIASITSKAAIELTKLLINKGANFYYYIQNSKIEFVRKYIHEQFKTNDKNLLLIDYNKQQNIESFTLRDINSEYHIEMNGGKIISSSKKDLRNYL